MGIPLVVDVKACSQGGQANPVARYDETRDVLIYERSCRCHTFKKILVRKLQVPVP